MYVWFLVTYLELTTSIGQGWQCDSHKQFVTCRLSQTVANCLKLVITGANCHKPFAAHKPAVAVTIPMHITVVIWIKIRLSMFIETDRLIDSGAVQKSGKKRSF